MTADMTHEMAVRVLNRVKDGVNYPEQIIRKALFLTGDLHESSKGGPEPGGDSPGFTQGRCYGAEPSQRGTWGA